MQTKVFVISEVQTGGEEITIAVRLTFEAARAIAKKKGGRRVERFLATKSPELGEDEQGIKLEH